MTKSSPHKVFVFALFFVFVSCSKPTTPKPYGYFRIATPNHDYTTYMASHMAFSINQTAHVNYPEEGNDTFFNIEYPSLNSTIHCTYLPIKNNLSILLKDAQEMVYSHTVKASAIPEQAYIDNEHKTYGMLYELQGNTATPAQFYLTDSVHNFMRASVYINTIPNQDSLAPIIDFLVTDVREMMESIRWKQ